MNGGGGGGGGGLNEGVRSSGVASSMLIVHMVTYSGPWHKMSATAISGTEADLGHHCPEKQLSAVPSITLTVFLVVRFMSAEISNSSREPILAQLLDGDYHRKVMFSEGCYDI